MLYQFPTFYLSTFSNICFFFFFYFCLFLLCCNSFLLVFDIIFFRYFLFLRTHTEDRQVKLVCFIRRSNIAISIAIILETCFKLNWNLSVGSLLGVCRESCRVSVIFVRQFDGISLLDSLCESVESLTDQLATFASLIYFILMYIFIGKCSHYQKANGYPQSTSTTVYCDVGTMFSPDFLPLFFLFKSSARLIKYEELWTKQ